MAIWISQGNMRNRYKGAFSGPLICPYCSKQSWKFVENISPYRIRYMCKGCGKTTQYDFTNNLNHPYATFGKSKWRRIVDRWSQAKAAKVKNLR